MEQKINERTYVELAQVFKCQNDVAEKIPNEILDDISNKAKNANYDFDYSKYDILNKISKEAFCIYVFLYTKYVASNEEKQQIKNMLAKNELNYQNELREKYNPDNLFKNKAIINDNVETKNVSMIEYKESIFTKIVNWFMHVFRKENM